MIQMSSRNKEKALLEKTADDLTKQGWSVWIEVPLQIGGREIDVDLLARRGDEVMIVEITTAKKEQRVEEMFDTIRSGVEGAERWTMRSLRLDDEEAWKVQPVDVEQLLLQLDEVLRPMATRDQRLGGSVVMQASAIVEMVLQRMVDVPPSAHMSIAKLARLADKQSILPGKLVTRLLKLSVLRNECAMAALGKDLPDDAADFAYNVARDVYSAWRAVTASMPGAYRAIH